MHVNGSLPPTLSPLKTEVPTLLAHAPVTLISGTGSAVKTENTGQSCVNRETKKSAISPTLSPLKTEVPTLTFDTKQIVKLMGINANSVREAAKKKGVEIQSVVVTEGKRKGKLNNIYPADSLFAKWPEVKTAWEAQNQLNIHIQEAAERLQEETAKPPEHPIETRPMSDREVARSWHLQRIDEVIREKGCGTKPAIRLYAARLVDKRVELPDWVASFYPEPSFDTLYLWHRKYKAEGMAGLTWRNKGCKTTHWTRHPDQAEFVESFFLNEPTVSATKLYQGIKATFKTDLPSQTTVNRWLDTYKEKNPQAVLMSTSPDRAKSSYQVAFGSRSAHVKRLNQLWELDGTSANIRFKGDSGRYKVLGAEDVFSGRIVLTLAESESGQALGQLLFKAINRLGAVETVKTDNGKAFVGKFATRLYADLNIEHIRCTPFSGEQKPHIENSLGRFNHDFVPVMPGATGANVAEAQDRRSRKTFAQRLKEAKEGEDVETGVTKEYFEKFMEDWCLAEDHRPRKNGRLKGKTPAQVVDAWAAKHTVRRIKDIEGLAYLLIPPVTKTIGKKGIKYNHYIYIAPELGDLVGREVEIRASPDTPGRIAVFYNGEFLCIAKEPRLENIDQAEVAARARARQQAANKVTRAYQRAVRKHVNPLVVVESILEDRLSEASKVSIFQQPEQLSTVSTEAAIAARVAEDLAVRAAKEQRKAPIEDDFEPTPAEKQELERINQAPLEDPEDLYFRVKDAIERGEDISPEDQDHYDRFLQANPALMRLRQQQPPHIAQVG